MLVIHDSTEFDFASAQSRSTGWAKSAADRDAAMSPTIAWP